MERVPEPELMDSAAQTEAYAAADFAESNQMFVETLAERLLGSVPGGRLIDLGCGPADICIRLSRLLPEWSVLAVDAGPNMLARAREAVAEAGLGRRIELRLSHLPDPGLPADHFDAVISNSLLHHLPEPADLWEAVRTTGKPGAGVLVMDLARPESVTVARQLVETHAADAPDVLREDFFHSLRAAYTPAEIRGQLEQAGLGQLEILTPTDRHWMALGRLPA